MKKKYMKPSFRVVELQHKCQLLAGIIKNSNNSTNSCACH